MDSPAFGLNRQMIDAEKYVIRRGNVAAEFVLLEQQIAHVGGDAFCDKIQNLIWRRSVHIDAVGGRD